MGVVYSVTQESYDPSSVSFTLPENLWFSVFFGVPTESRTDAWTLPRTDVTIDRDVATGQQSRQTRS